MADPTKNIVQMQDADEQGNPTAYYYPTTLASAVVLANGTNMEDKVAAMQDDLAKLLYVAPKVTVSATKSAGYFELGTTVALTVNANVTEHSKDITKLAILKGSTEVATDTSGATQLSFDDSITTDTTYKATATDGETNSTSTNMLSYRFVNPVYWGSVAADVDAITEEIITGFASVSGGKVIGAKASKASQLSHTYNLNSQKMVIATPTVTPTWAITAIYDPNGFDITSSFTHSTVTVNGVAYNVYVSNATSQTNFVVKFY